MIIPSEIRGLHNRMHPAKRSKTKNSRAKIKKWCQLSRSIKAKRQKQTGVKQGLGVILGFVRQ